MCMPSPLSTSDSLWVSFGVVLGSTGGRLDSILMSGTVRFMKRVRFDLMSSYNLSFLHKKTKADIFYFIFYMFSYHICIT